jgi:hypothetical protein
MSVVTEYFVAAEHDVAVTFAGWRWGTGTIPPPGAELPVTPVVSPDLSRFARAILRGISPTELITLRKALGRAANIEHEQGILRPVILAPPVSGRTQWVHQVPAELVDALSKLSEQQVDSVGGLWAAEELLRIETLSDESVMLARRMHHRTRFWQDMLSEIVTLASLASEKGEGLYLFMHM